MDFDSFERAVVNTCSNSASHASGKLLVCCLYC